MRANVRMLCPKKKQNDKKKKKTRHLLHLRVSGAFVRAKARRQKLTFLPLVYIYLSALQDCCLLLQDAERLVRFRQKSVSVPGTADGKWPLLFLIIDASD